MRRAILALIAVLYADVSAPGAMADALSLAERLAHANAEATRPADMETLLRLQLAAGQWTEAEATIARAEAAYRELRSSRAWALTPWRVYARARRYEEAGNEPRALERAFADVMGPLSPRDFAAVLPWFGSNIDRVREAQARAAESCAGVAIDLCPQAAQLLAARQALVTWTYLTPASEPLVRAEIRRRFIVDGDLLIDTADDAQVAAILIRPRDEAGPLTALLNFTIYARDDWATSDAVAMAAHGYAGMVAYSRGKGRSPGPSIPYEHDGADAAAVIDWLAAQNWSDGRVGMFSGSYNASTQWGAVKHHPRALRAIATHASNAPGIDTPMQGNVFLNFIYPWPLYATDADGLDEVNYGDRNRWAALNRIWYASGRSYRELEQIDGHPNSVFRTWLDHPSYDRYWQRFIPVGQEFADVDIPVFVQTGYFDGGMVGALYYAREHYRHRPSADHRMLIGPYHHTAMTQGVLANVNGYAVDEAARIDLQDVRMQWFDHVFRGAPLPDLLSGRINFEIMGANVWRHVDTLDAMANGTWRLFLSGRRDGDRFLFAETAGSGEPNPELIVDLADRSDVDVQIPFDQLDTRNALAFATAPLSGPLEIAGSFRAEFDIVTNKRDFDLSVALFEQKADGSFLPLSSYLGRASYMADRSHRRLLRPGRAHHMTFESQTVTARRVDAGSRIVALIGVPRQPDFQINYGTGRDVSDESAANAGEPLQIRWSDRSYLDLGVRR